MLKASPSTLQAMRGASPLQVVTSTRGSFMYPMGSRADSANCQPHRQKGRSRRTEEGAELEQNDGNDELAEQEE